MKKSTKLLLASCAVAVIGISTNAMAQSHSGSGGTMMSRAGASPCAPRSGAGMGQGGGMHGGGGMNMAAKHGQMGGGGQGGMHGGKSGMMGSGKAGGQGHMGGGMRVTPAQHLSVDDVSHYFGHHLEGHGNKRLKVGEVSQKDENTIAANIVTVDGSLVQAFEVDLHSGAVKKVN